MIVCFIERANGSATRPGLEGPFRDGLRVPEALESRTVVWLGCKTRFFNSADDCRATCLFLADSKYRTDFFFARTNFSLAKCAAIC